MSIKTGRARIVDAAHAFFAGVGLQISPVLAAESPISGSYGNRGVDSRDSPALLAIPALFAATVTQRRPRDFFAILRPPEFYAELRGSLAFQSEKFGALAAML